MHLEVLEASREILPSMQRKTRAVGHYSQGIEGTQEESRKKGRKIASFLRSGVKTLVKYEFSTLWDEDDLDPTSRVSSLKRC